MRNKVKLSYDSPKLEIMEMEVEQGFAGSDPNENEFFINGGFYSNEEEW